MGIAFSYFMSRMSGLYDELLCWGQGKTVLG